jgi:hypothetical protein
MEEDFQLYLLIDDVLKHDYHDPEVFTRRQEHLAQVLLEASAVERETAKDYILMLIATTAIDEVDGNSYVEYIEDIEAGRTPSLPELKNAEYRQSREFIDTLKSSDSHYSTGLTWLGDFLSPRSVTPSYLTPKGHVISLLESIASTARFYRILTALALRPTNHAFAALLKPPCSNQLNSFVSVLEKLLHSRFSRVMKQFAVAKASHDLKTSLLVGVLKGCGQKLVTANIARGFNNLKQLKSGTSRDFSMENSFTPVHFRPYDIFERERLRQSAACSLVFKTKLTVEQLALWRWVLFVREKVFVLKNIAAGLKKIRGIGKRCRKYVAVTLWHSLLPQPSRFTSYINSPDKTMHSEFSSLRSSAYNIYLSRLNKLNLLSVLVMSVRCSVEQIALWKWKLAVTHQKRKLIIRILKLCARAAVTQRAKVALHQWKGSTSKRVRCLPQVVMKATLRWYFIRKTAFAALSKLTEPVLRRANSMWESLVRLN